MEEWDGDEFRTTITQVGKTKFFLHDELAAHVITCSLNLFLQTLVDSTREVMVGEIIFSPSNELDRVKDKLLNPNGEEDDA
jgi:hypothetical protein